MTGINLSGYLRTESGVGEIARRYARALRRLDVPLAINDLSSLSGNRAGDGSVAGISDGCPHDVNIVCIDVHQHHALLGERGREFFDGRYNIGVWLWELTQFPGKWHDRFAYYDEIWVPSSFIANTLAPIAPVPVVTMPTVLTPAARGSRERGRSRLRIDDDEFLCLFVFDVNSTLARKNPAAAIDAFRRAFELRDRARLVLKFVNGASDAAGIRALAEGAAGHIVDFVDGYWPAEDVRDLFEACDAYISLHRSEGLGLTIADALALGKPVIATDWSGSRDFVNARNAFPVGYSLVRNPRKAGPYAKGAVWAEASAHDAAEVLRSIFDDPSDAQRRGEAARADIETAYSEAAVASVIGKRLEALANRRRGSQYREEQREVYAKYERLGGALTQWVDRFVPERASVAVISKGDDRLLAFRGRRASHFPQLSDGSYAGWNPADGEGAVAHLEEVRAAGVEWLVIPSTASWWLEHYPEFAAHLRERCEVVASDEEVGRLVRLSARGGNVISEETWERRN